MIALPVVVTCRKRQARGEHLAVQRCALEQGRDGCGAGCPEAEAGAAGARELAELAATPEPHRMAYVPGMSKLCVVCRQPFGPSSRHRVRDWSRRRTCSTRCTRISKGQHVDHKRRKVCACGVVTMSAIGVCTICQQRSRAAAHIAARAG